MKQTHWIALIAWIIIFEGIGFALGLLTKSSIDTWYVYLNKSSLTPPSIVFSIVWSILYALLAITGYKLSHLEKTPPIQRAVELYWTQMIMNWAWTPFFFYKQWIGFSFLWLIVIIIITADLILKIGKHSKTIANLLLPYFFWLFFAAYLNGAIWYLN